ncbi:glycosyltransferase [Providencia vermicola]|uniref:glycosyltransferase n=1 Tax=Providencia vermicola TaxID=333965 RepID=UPI0032D9C113
MKIGYIAKNIPLPGYKENPIILKQANIFKKTEHEVIFYYPDEHLPFNLTKFLPLRFAKRIKTASKLNNSFTSHDIHINKLSYCRIYSTPYIEWLFIKNKSYNIDSDIKIIHAHFIFPDGLIALSLFKKNNIPYVITVREGDFKNANKNFLNKKIMKSVLDNARAIIALTYSLEKKIKLFNPAAPIYRVGNLLDNTFYHTHYVPSNSNRITISVVSNFISRKNIDWLIEYHNLKKSFNLIICGDGPLNKELKKKSNSEIIFTGYLDTEGIKKVLDKSDVFVLPSVNETFGMAYIEAASRHNIVIGMEGTGIYEPGLDGFYFAKNKLHLYKILDMVIGFPTNYIEELKKLAYNHSLSFKENVIKDKLLQIYKEHCL